MIKQKRPWEYLLYAALFVAAVFLYIYITPNGLGLTNDSAAYLGGARCISEGMGYSRLSGDRQPRPITQFPPGYSLVIYLTMEIFSVDAFDAAWKINLICFLANLFLFMALSKKLTGKSILAIGGGIWFLICAPISQAHGYGLSEALFLVFFQAALLIALQINQKAKGLLFAGLGFLCGAMTLTRYVGVATFIAILLFMAVREGEMTRPFLKRTGFFILGFLAPISLWLLRNAGLHENAVNRKIFFHPPTADRIREGLMNCLGFFLPEFGGFIEKLFPFLVALLCAVFLVICAEITISIARVAKRKCAANAPISSPVLLIEIQLTVYLFTLIAVATFVDGSTVFDQRMLLPFYVCACLLLLSFIGRLMKHANRKNKILASLFFFVFAAFFFEDELDLIQMFHADGQGFASDSWRESETRNAAAKIPEDALIFSNRQTFMWLMNDQPAYILPPMVNVVNQEELNSFEQDRRWMADEILSGNGYAVIFTYQDMMEDEGDRVWLEAVLQGLPLYGEYADGAIFGRKNSE